MVMRKISFILSLAIFYIPLSFYGAELEKVEVNSLCYYINKETKTAEVTQGQYDKIKKMLDESNGTLEIPSVINVNEANYTITSVGNSAFAEIYYFCVLNLPETLTSIGDEAFAKNKIDSLSIPDNVTTIGKAAFRDCGYLRAINIGEGIKSIGSQAFYGCPSLNRIYIHANSIPDAVSDTFGDFNYYYANYQSMELYVPANLVKDYQKTTSAPWIYFNDDNILEFGNVSPQTHKKEIVVGGFTYCLDETNHKAEITNGRFFEGKRLSIPESITVDDAEYQVTSIGMSAFSTCYSIEDIIIPNSVITIGKLAFNDCLNTTSMTIGKGVKAIGAGAFHGMSSLRYVYVLSSEIPETTEYYSDFSNGDWTYVTLYVPSELVNAYREPQFPYWETVKDENIKELENTTSIRRTRTYASQVVYYALDGHRIKTLQKGINIIHQSDGTVRKEIVR